MPHRSMRIRFNFVILIFVVSMDYENIFTTKISRFTVAHKCWCMATCIFENDLFLEYRLNRCRLAVSEAWMLGQSLTFTTKLHSIV